MTTSREPLRIYGERELPVPPLEVPALTPALPLAELERAPAVQLFIERAQQVKSDFALTRANLETVAQICAALDGLPLAIEMAAARVKWETPQTILEKLQHHTEQLRDARQPDPRQTSWRSAMDWSYELLNADEQRVLRHLGVFRGGFTLDAADAVCAVETRPFIEGLVEKSLVQRQETPPRAARYDLLEMVREYVVEKLNAHAESEAALERRCAYFTALAKQLGSDMLQP